MIDRTISGIPMIWNDRLSLIVVGAVNQNGKIAPVSQFIPPPRFPNCKVNLWASGELTKDFPTGPTGVIRYAAGTSLCMYMKIPLAAFY